MLGDNLGKASRTKFKGAGTFGRLAKYIQNSRSVIGRPLANLPYPAGLEKNKIK